MKDDEKQRSLFRDSERRRLEAQRLCERAQKLIEDSENLIASSDEYLRATQAQENELLKWIGQGQNLHRERERPCSSKE